MLDRAIAAGMSASYALMDSWFTHAPLIQEIVDRGLHVIGMVKNDNKALSRGRATLLPEGTLCNCDSRVEGQEPQHPSLQFEPS